MPGTRRSRVLLTTTTVALLALGPVAGCGGGDGTPSAAPSAPPGSAPATATAAPGESERTAAVEAARGFLASLVAEDHEAAYARLSPRAQAELPLAEYAEARAAKNASARSLGQSYELADATGEPPSVTVSGRGRVADGTAVDIVLPMVLVDQEWRVDAVPTSY